MRTHAWLSSGVFVVSALIGVATAAAGQARDTTLAPPMRLIGVFDARTGAPLPGVQIRDAFTGTYALTTTTGTASLVFLSFRGAAAIVELRKLGYQAKELVVTRADTAPITEILEPFAELAPVVTTERYRIDRDAGQWNGFEQRCQSKSVTCFRNDDLERRPAANIADFLIHADGVTMGTCGNTRGPGANTRNAQCGKIAMRSVSIPPSYCQPTFYVDGFEWDTKAGAPTDLAPNTPATAPYTPANVKAIEVYPPERARPMRFQGDPLCGVVVIWTK